MYMSRDRRQDGKDLYTNMELSMRDLYKPRKKYRGHPDFYKYTQEEIALHDKKNSDYAGSGDPLGNFNRVAKMVGPLLNPAIPDNLKPMAVAMIYAAKQFDAVVDLLGNNRQSIVEGFDGRLMDIAVYAKLARILSKEAK